jgi:hypothetical protein
MTYFPKGCISTVSTTRHLPVFQLECLVDLGNPIFQMSETMSCVQTNYNEDNLNA